MASAMAARRSGSTWISAVIAGSAARSMPVRISAIIAFGIFGARVVGGDDGDLGQRGGQAAHDRALGAIAVSAAAEDHSRRAGFSSRAERSRFSRPSGVCA